ncbi:MAG: ROK family protein [Bacteroidaceae bacterium]|nr:ROK family protein [Bacteroidaceae bacterium]
MPESLAIGIDVGGQSAKCGVVTRSGVILRQCVISSMQPTLDGFMSSLGDAVKMLCTQTAHEGTVIGIGADAPNANYYKGTIESAPNLKWARDSQGRPAVIPFSELLSERTGLKVTLTNDANAAALGERTYGVARGMDNFIMITLGTGVGSGIVTDGRLVYGSDGFAGELGHVCVERDGRQCNCGLKGCLETYASATGVARSARQMLQDDPRPSLLRNLAPETITSKDVFDAAAGGDSLSKDIFTYTGRILGHAFADFVKFSAPEAIILFGGLTKSRQFFHDEMVREMNANLMDIWKGKVQVLYSSLKESDAAILGASSLVW